MKIYLAANTPWFIQWVTSILPHQASHLETPKHGKRGRHAGAFVYAELAPLPRDVKLTRSVTLTTALVHRRRAEFAQEVVFNRRATQSFESLRFMRFFYFSQRSQQGLELPAAPFLTTPVANSLYFLHQYKFADYAAPRIAYCRLLEAQESIDTK